MDSDRYQYCPLCGQALTTFHDGERLRRRCENCGWVYYRNPTAGVAVILFDDDELLLGKRRSGGWCIPCGHVEWDETIEDAARREIHEETGLDVTIKEVFAVHSNFHNPQQHTVGIWYLGKSDDFSKATPGGDLIELRTFPLTKLPPLVFPTDEKVVEQLKDHFLQP
jgi:8-oxo-dGTP diphosphatase